MNKFLLSVVFFFSLAIYGQDTIYLNNNKSLDCKIISIEDNIIQYEDISNGQIKTLHADTLQGFVYQGKEYINRKKRREALNARYEDPNTTNTYLRLSLLIPGFSFENRLNRSLSINVEAGIGFVYGFNTAEGFSEVYVLYRESGNMDNKSHQVETENFIDVYPYLKLEFRKYYNLLRRQKKSRSNLYNSADFVSLYTLAFWDNLYVIGPTWGMQRNANRFYFNLNLGAGLYIWPESTEFYPILDFRLGIRIGNQK